MTTNLILLSQIERKKINSTQNLKDPKRGIAVSNPWGLKYIQWTWHACLTHISIQGKRCLYTEWPDCRSLFSIFFGLFFFFSLNLTWWGTTAHAPLINMFNFQPNKPCAKRNILVRILVQYGPKRGIRSISWTPCYTIKDDKARTIFICRKQIEAPAVGLLIF
jgi:hypothetical protein